MSGGGASLSSLVVKLCKIRGRVVSNGFLSLYPRQVVSPIPPFNNRLLRRRTPRIGGSRLCFIIPVLVNVEPVEKTESSWVFDKRMTKRMLPDYTVGTTVTTSSGSGQEPTSILSRIGG